MLSYINLTYSFFNLKRASLTKMGIFDKYNDLKSIIYQIKCEQQVLFEHFLGLLNKSHPGVFQGITLSLFRAL